MNISAIVRYAGCLSLLVAVGCSSGGSGRPAGGTGGRSAGGTGGAGQTGSGGGGADATGGAGNTGGNNGTTGTGGGGVGVGTGGGGTGGAGPGSGGAGAQTGTGGAGGPGTGGRGGASGASGSGGRGTGGGAVTGTGGGTPPAGMPTVQDFHLTARPWTPLNYPRDRYLKNVEGVVRAMVKYQDSSGAIIDPVKKQEWQYGTPMFAYAAAALVETGTAPDLMSAATKAMDHSTGDVAAGTIPNGHGPFFIAPLAGAYNLLKSKASASQLDQWKKNLSVPIENTGTIPDDNWRTYSMKGQWMRSVAGIVSNATAQEWVEYGWTGTSAGRSTIVSQRSHVHPPELELYHDIEIEPETYAYDSVARMNLEAVLENGYTGPSAKEIQQFTTVGGETIARAFEPSGQGAAGGRSTDHCWDDVVPQNLFERLANRYMAAGDAERAGRFRRAAMLALRGTDRWKRQDGSYSITKNQFDFNLQVHYASYSARTNYNGNMMYHQAESYYEHKDGVEEWPTWTEIGGYGLLLDEQFAGAFMNAGGMHVQVAWRGQTTLNYGLYWTTLGVTRFGRVDWDSRLGPSDGIRDEKTGLGISFSPTYSSGGSWTRLASVPSSYRAKVQTTFASPVLVKFTLDYMPSGGGPTFHEDYVVTPDGVLSTLTSSATAGNFGMTWPLLSYDGTSTLVTAVGDNLASTRFPTGTDEQNFIAVGGGTATLVKDGTVRSGYGDLQAVRYVAAAGSATQTFVYPRNGTDPTGAAVRDSFMVTANGFKSILGRVEGNTYVGRTSAGGEASSLDIDGDGKADLSFDKACKFIVQLANGKVTAVEANSAVMFTLGTNAPIALKPFVPVRF